PGEGGDDFAVVDPRLLFGDRLPDYFGDKWIDRLVEGISGLPAGRFLRCGVGLSRGDLRAGRAALPPPCLIETPGESGRHADAVLVIPVALCSSVLLAVKFDLVVHRLSVVADVARFFQIAPRAA